VRRAVLMVANDGAVLDAWKIAPQAFGVRWMMVG
jgi:hypothetical protein